MIADNNTTETRKGRTMKTIEISRGNQYDKDGFRMTDDVCSSYGSADATKENGYCLDGNLWPWSFPNEAEINAAILATLVDGLTRLVNIEMDSDSGAVIVSTEHDPEPTGFGVCPRCHTYCCGDCRQ